MIDGCDEVLGGAESKRSMVDGLDLVVHALNGSVRKARFVPGEDPVQARSEHFHEFLKWFQPRSHG